MATIMYDPLGILETSEVPVNNRDHYDVGDDWEIIMQGEEVRRPKNLQRVAITRVEVTFDSEKNLEMFLELIRQSDERLSQIPDGSVMYEWQMVRAKGLTVRFGVTWYDFDFYKNRKDAYLSVMHENLFDKFGITASSMRIEHIPL